MTTKAKNDQTTKQAAQVAGIVLASLLALTAIVTAVIAPTDLSDRPLSTQTLTP
ncbi:hypothetical protein [Caulobacter segnis]|uniref:Uncharacterized protein n=1 Tax=Caulobacter segnis (strain ATCC 21756 / DSM 7131 / JCM 7823 / NBRC 15250 / LMG 17158 / TK0059) TaxID=509190 RepID=D5VNC2_CAUST|nr:hypothetical protein [Caulobacter segnis]ADG11995.1 hypothetical protein Cseg_3569 [Caulobacter segnis ATCC 21756]